MYCTNKIARVLFELPNDMLTRLHLLRHVPVKNKWIAGVFNPHKTC